MDVIRYEAETVRSWLLVGALPVVPLKCGPTLIHCPGARADIEPSVCRPVGRRMVPDQALSGRVLRHSDKWVACVVVEVGSCVGCGISCR